MNISLVIPVWNDLAGLERLLAQVAEMNIFAQIIVSDDASDEAVGPQSVNVASGLLDRVLWLRSDVQRGAGHARNLGLTQVTGSHVVFFDSDDLFAADFPQIVEQAKQQAEDFDFLIYRHDDSRLLDQGSQGTFSSEEKLWNTIGAGPDAKLLSLEERQTLCTLAAYPWNKIYRTEFLRANRIGCTEIPVHNDIELHWNSFILADRVLACSLVGATHFVRDGGERLTNRRDADRLEVFQSFRGVMERLVQTKTTSQLGFMLPFARFCWRLLGWVRNSLDPVYLPELHRRSACFFLDHFDRNMITLIAFADPGLARKINRLVLRGDLP